MKRSAPLIFLLLILAVPSFAKSNLAGATVFIIRHAEKPEAGTDLSPAGRERAEAYVNYFKKMGVDTLFAAADSKDSQRPHETLLPLSRALGVPLDLRFKDKQFEKIAADLQSHVYGKHILICWHHGEIPKLVRALGADPNKLLPEGKWPAHVFGWMLELHFDQDGRIIPQECRRVAEHLTPDDK